MRFLSPKRCANGIKKLRKHIEEQYLSLAIQIKSKFSSRCMKEFAELQNFCTQQKRNWNAKADVVNEHWTVVSGCTIMAHEMKDKSLVGLKHTE